MPATYEPIATTTLGSAQANIDFSSISSAYTDLRLVIICQSTTNANSTDYRLDLQFNGNTATNYSSTRLKGTGASALSFADTSGTKGRIGLLPGIGTSLGTGLFNGTVVDIFSYAGSTNKTWLAMPFGDANGQGNVEAVVGMWRSTSAINQITIIPASGNLNTGTTATLFGILKA